MRKEYTKKPVNCWICTEQELRSLVPGFYEGLIITSENNKDGRPHDVPNMVAPWWTSIFWTENNTEFSQYLIGSNFIKSYNKINPMKNEHIM